MKAAAFKPFEAARLIVPPAQQAQPHQSTLATLRELEAHLRNLNPNEEWADAVKTAIGWGETQC